MRIITKKAIEAFLKGVHFGLDNTQVLVYDSVIHLVLHGNLIAQRDRKTGSIRTTTAGWNTLTTRERLNGIPGVSVTTKAGQLYLNGIIWSGDWKTV